MVIERAYLTCALARTARAVTVGNFHVLQPANEHLLLAHHLHWLTFMSLRQTRVKDNSDTKVDQALTQALGRHGSKTRSAGVLVQPSDASESAQLSPSSTVSAHDEAIANMNNKIHELRIADSLANGESLVQDQQPTTDPEKQTSKAENIYDPFDGQRIGILVSESRNKAEDDLWDHLTHIRTLQSEIAKMHAQMEGLGEGERQQMNDERADADEELKAAKFARLGDRFNGRKEAIDAIMNKVSHISTVRPPRG